MQCRYTRVQWDLQFAKSALRDEKDGRAVKCEAEERSACLYEQIINLYYLKTVKRVY